MMNWKVESKTISDEQRTKDFEEELINIALHCLSDLVRGAYDDDGPNIDKHKAKTMQCRAKLLGNRNGWRALDEVGVDAAEITTITNFRVVEEEVVPTDSETLNAFLGDSGPVLSGM